MARGKKLSLDEQLEKITNEIDNMENSLKEMKKAKKDLEDQIKQARLSELDELISEKGLSFEEIKKMLGCEEQPIGYSFCLCKINGSDFLTTLLSFVDGTFICLKITITVITMPLFRYFTNGKHTK